MSRQEIPGAPSAKRWLALVAIVATAPGGCGFDAERTGSPEGREAVQPPNILWVVWDTVRADRLTPYAPGLATTPRLANWARRARVFDDAVSSASTTESSHASMFTGLLPSQHGTDAENRWLAEEWETPAERLRGEGYRTFLWSANPHVSAGTNFDQGFDRVEHPWDPAHRRRALEIVTRKVEGDASSELSERLQRPRVGPWAIKAAGELAAGSLESWLNEEDPDRPWFAV
ncbi:MAG: sulfatase-like hydrolase/transferase, partial [Myxococcota bacterium]